MRGARAVFTGAALAALALVVAFQKIRALPDAGVDVSPERALTAALDPRVRRAAAVALADARAKSAVPLLLEVADADPCLAVADDALLSAAALGAPGLLPRVAELLDATALPDVRERAGRTLLDLTGADFAGNRAAAEAWLKERGLEAPAAPASSAPLPIVGNDSALRVDIEARAVAVALAPERADVAGLVLELEGHSIVIDVVADGDGLWAECTDVPAVGGKHARHARIAFQRGAAGEWVVRVPRRGVLARAEPPRAFRALLR